MVIPKPQRRQKFFPAVMTDLKLGRTLFARVTNWNKISLELFDVNHSSTFVVKVWIDSKEVFVETFIDHLIMFYCSFAAVLLQFYGRIPNNAKHIGSFSQLLWPKTWKDSRARVTNWNKISLELFEVNHSSAFLVKVWIDSKEVFVENLIDHLIMSWSKQTMKPGIQKPHLCGFLLLLLLGG